MQKSFKIFLTMTEITNPTVNKTSLIKKLLVWLLSILAIACLVAGITIPIVILKNKEQVPGSDVVNSATSVIDNSNYDYLNKNSVSLLLTSNPNYNYLNLLDAELQNYFGQNYDVPAGPSSIASIDCGTSWIVDYSTDPVQNLATYYLATNIHVINLSYTLTYNLQPKVNGNLFENVQPIKLTLSVPVNPTTASSFSAYITQPLGKKTPEYPNGYSVISNVPQAWNQQWFQIPNINLNTLNETIIPLGATNNSQVVPASTPYYGTYTISGGINGTGYLTQNGYVPKNQAKVETNVQGQDFGLVKMQVRLGQSLAPNSWFRYVWPYGWVASSYASKDTNIKIIFNHLNQMFNINPTDKVTIDSSYIAKLNYLISQLENKQLTKQELNQFFMFGNVKNLGSTKNLYVAGYPGGTGSQGLSNVYFNAGYADVSDVQQVSDVLNRNTLDYYYQGNLHLEDYNKSNNYFLPGVNLYPGSSGSMVINDNNQIVGIYWGAIRATNSVGLFTPFFVTGFKNNLLYKLLEYQSLHDPNSQLVHLFTLLNQWYVTNK